MTGKRGIQNNAPLFLNKKIRANTQDYVLIVMCSQHISTSQSKFCFETVNFHIISVSSKCYMQSCLSLAMAACQCNKYQNLIYWFICCCSSLEMTHLESGLVVMDVSESFKYNRCRCVIAAYFSQWKLHVHLSFP